MPRPGITYIDVAKAATMLFEQNIRPSIEGVRRILGTGSNSTINRHLRDWRGQQGNQMALEQGLPDSLLIAVRGLYETLTAESTEKVEQIKTETNTRLSNLQMQLDEMSNEQTRLQQNKHALEEALQVSQEEKAALQRHLDTTQKNVDKLANENALLQSKLQDKTSEIERLLKQLTHAQHNLEHYRETLRQERATEQQQFAEKIAALEKRRQSQAEQLSIQDRQIAALEQQRYFFENEKNNLSKKLDTVMVQWQQSELEKQKNKLQYHQLNDRHVKMVDDNKSLLATLKKDDQTIQQLTIDNEKVKAQFSVLAAAVEKAETTVRHVTDKNLLLMQEKTNLQTQLKQALATQRSG